jgi:N-acetylmuramoyl-L-alanine amidase
MKNLLFLLLLFPFVYGSAQTDLSELKFCIDPGHGNYPNDKPFETRINQRVANFLKSYLEYYGAWVILTRQDSTESLSLSQREYIANSNNVDFFHSIHHNAFKGNANYTLMLYEEKSDGRPEWPGRSDVMCGIMADYLYDFLYTTGKYVKGDLSALGFNLGVLNDLMMPGVLSEASFWDYVPETQRLNALGYLRLEAFSQLYAYLKYYGAQKKRASYIEGIVKDTEGEILSGITVYITNDLDENTYVTDSQNIGITDQDRGWGGFPNITEVKNGLFFFEGFPAGPVRITFSGENVFSKTITFTVKDSTSNRISGIELISKIPPRIVYTYPSQGESGFSALNDISFEFSRRMDTTSVETTMVFSPPVNGEYIWSNENKLLIIHPDSLNYDTDYSITVSGEAKDIYGFNFDGDGDGTGGDNFVLSFRTGPFDVLPPRITAIYPGQNAYKIELKPVINIAFDEKLDPASVTPDIFELERSMDNSSVSGMLKHYSVDGRSVINFFPEERLNPYEIYKIRIFSGLRDSSGNEISTAKVFSFRTSDTDWSITGIDDFEADFTDSWLNPLECDSTSGVITDSTGIFADTRIVNYSTGSGGSLAIKYGWDSEKDSWLIDECLADTASAKGVTFTEGAFLQIYVFGDGSGNKFRFCVEDNVTGKTESEKEVSPWFSIDWIGWKLISWDMANDGTGAWTGDGILDGILRFHGIQLTHASGKKQFGTVYFDDLRLARSLPTSITGESALLPDDFVLYQNYPNPFNPGTTIRYAVPGNSYVRLDIYNVKGQLIRNLVSKNCVPGVHSVWWNGKDQEGKGVSSGVYFYRLTAEGGRSVSAKMLLVK